MTLSLVLFFAFCIETARMKLAHAKKTVFSKAWIEIFRDSIVNFGEASVSNPHWHENKCKFVVVPALALGLIKAVPQNAVAVYHW